MRAAPFVASAVLSAALLFSLELLIGRLLLPLLGGASGVWTTCLLFFQGALLGGYAYAHGLQARLGARRALAVHAGVLAAAALALPPAVPAGWSPPVAGGWGAEPAWLLALLTVAIGAPFAAVSATAPLLQAAFAQTPGRPDPYPLYGASNAGSLVALLAYPLAIEPRIDLAAQATAWTAGYGLLGIACVGCAAAAVGATPRRAPADAGEEAAPDRRAMLRWGLLAFVPAALLYGTTTLLTTDLAAAPLLWVAPLSLYLLSFVLAFARRRRRVPRPVLAALLPPLLAAMALAALAGHLPGWGSLVLHLTGAFAASLLLHRDLADRAPPPAHLTRYYLVIAAGGLLAGVACALVAPLLAASVIELPAALVLAALLVGDAPGPTSPKAARWVRRSQLLALGLVAPALVAGFTTRGAWGQLLAALAFAPALVALAIGLRARARAALGAALVVAVGLCSLGPPPLLRVRSFFGVHQVVERSGYRHYLNGTTVHGRQALAAERRRDPLAYYDPLAPIGQAVGRWRQAWRTPRPPRVGVVGLGIGGLLPYQRAGDPWTLFEVDPVVLWVARDSGAFSYLPQAAGRVRVVLGDGRRSLAAERAAGAPPYDLLVLDAFGSDSVPVHLLTEEAFRLYLARLAPDGLLVVNVSNRFVDLPQLLAGVAARLDLAGRVRLDAPDLDRTAARARQAAGRADSQAVVLTRRAGRLAVLGAGWRDLAEVPAATPWTDQRIDLLSVLR